MGDPASIPGSGRYSGEGNGNPLQYSCLENPMDDRASWATVHRVTKSQTEVTKRKRWWNTRAPSDDSDLVKLPSLKAFLFLCSPVHVTIHGFQTNVLQFQPQGTTKILSSNFRFLAKYLEFSRVNQMTTPVSYSHQQCAAVWFCPPSTLSYLPCSWE